MIKIYKGSVVQTVLDTNVVATIDTGLGVTDQKTLWTLKAIDLEWATNMAAKQYFRVIASLTRDPAKFAFLDDSVIAREAWSAVAGPATPTGNAIVLPLQKRLILLDEPQVANSKVYMYLETVNTGQINRVNFRLYYEETKVSEIDFLKAQTGYCVC